MKDRSVLFQVVFVLKSFYKVPREKIAEGLLTLLKYKGIAIKEKKIVRRTLELYYKKNIEIVDCYLVACLEGDKQNILYSYDRDFDKFNIKRIMPAMFVRENSFRWTNSAQSDRNLSTFRIRKSKN